MGLQGALANLRLEIGRGTIANILREAGLGPSSDRPVTTATKTAFSLAVVDSEPARPVRRRCRPHDRSFENMLYRGGQKVCALPRRSRRCRDRRCPAQWRKPGRVQRLARINVAEAGDHPLIEQGNLERRRLPFARAREGRGIECRRAVSQLSVVADSFCIHPGLHGRDFGR